MARMPKADWQGEQSPGNPMGGVDIVCVHTIVGWAPAHAAHFSTTFGGKIIQSRDTKFCSAANLEGNLRVIAIENEDGGKDVPLTAAQVEANAEILAWAHKVHGVPLRYCEDSRPTGPGSRGLAVHRQGIDGNFVLPDNTRGLPRSMWLGRVPGGEHWSTSSGKICPRDNKIRQVPEILARAKEIVNGDDDLNSEDRQWINQQLADEREKIAAAVAEKVFARDMGQDYEGTNFVQIIRRLARRAGIGGSDEAPDPR